MTFHKESMNQNNNIHSDSTKQYSYQLRGLIQVNMSLKGTNATLTQQKKTLNYANI